MISSNPSKSKAPAEPAEEPKDALEFVSYVREKLKTKLDLDEKKQANHDLELIVREIRAIIAVNDEIHEEIFSRCMVDVEHSVKHSIEVRRFEFKSIERRHVGSKIELFSHVEFDDDEFEVWALTELPPGMGDMVSVNYKPSTFQFFIDYDDYFRKALMLLRDDALELLLPKLKDHLEVVQVCLGEMHQWAMQSTNDLSCIGIDFKEVLKRRTSTEMKSNCCCFCGGKYNDSGYGTIRCTGVRCGQEIILKRFENNTSYSMSSNREKTGLLSL